MTLTKQDLQNIEEAFDKKLTKYQGAIIEVVDFKFQKLEQRINEFDRKLDRLATILGNFVKMMTDSQEEFAILKAEVNQIKRILKEKLGVEVAVQK